MRKTDMTLLGYKQGEPLIDYTKDNQRCLCHEEFYKKVDIPCDTNDTAQICVIYTEYKHTLCIVGSYEIELTVHVGSRWLKIVVYSGITDDDISSVLMDAEVRLAMMVDAWRNYKGGRS